MDDILGLIFLISLVASIYFLIRLLLRVIFGGETSGYRSKLVISLGLIIISFAIFFFADMFVEENMQEEAEQKLEELLEQNFPSE